MSQKHSIQLYRMESRLQPVGDRDSNDAGNVLGHRFTIDSRRLKPGLHTGVGRFGSLRAFSLADLMVTIAVIAVLAALTLPILDKTQSRAKLATCLDNLHKVNQAVLMYAPDNQQTLPLLTASKPPGGWWWYKEQVKRYAGITAASSANDKVFACPSDRGFEDQESAQPFWASKKYDYTSYVYNGVNLPGIPNIAGREISSIKLPAWTLLVMEWTAHAPLSWHESKTGKANTPFYNDAESVVGFVDGHVKLTKIYYDGYSAAYTRDPIPGYAYKYSGD